MRNTCLNWMFACVTACVYVGLVSVACMHVCVQVHVCVCAHVCVCVCVLGDQGYAWQYISPVKPQNSTRKTLQHIHTHTRAWRESKHTALLLGALNRIKQANIHTNTHTQTQTHTNTHTLLLPFLSPANVADKIKFTSQM